MEILKELRKKLNLTQQEISDKLGISRTSYTRYELGEREPDNTTLVKIANFFNVSVDYLLGNVNGRDSSVDDRPSSFGDNLKKIRNLKKLSQAELSQLLNVSQQTVGSWEVNRTTPTPEMIKKVAETLNVSSDMLLGISSDNDIAEKINALSPSSQEKALEYLKMLKLLENAETGKNITDLPKKA